MLKKEITEAGCDGVERIRRNQAFGEYRKNFGLHKRQGILGELSDD
jgi:hypothetical protein